MIYFDNSSTTKQSDAVTQKMIWYMQNDYANASSLHIAGVNAHRSVDDAKKEIAKAIYKGTIDYFENNKTDKTHKH